MKDLKIGICGEHGGDPDSVSFCDEVGMDYVSCSPYRVPIARLAAAQVVISRGAVRKVKTATAAGKKKPSVRSASRSTKRRTASPKTGARAKPSARSSPRVAARGKKSSTGKKRRR